VKNGLKEAKNPRNTCRRSRPIYYNINIFRYKEESVAMATENVKLQQELKSKEKMFDELDNSEENPKVLSRYISALSQVFLKSEDIILQQLQETQQMLIEAKGEVEIFRNNSTC
jgi:hypothetical protein